MTAYIGCQLLVNPKWQQCGGAATCNIALCALTCLYKHVLVLLLIFLANAIIVVYMKFLVMLLFLLLCGKIKMYA